MVGNVSGTRPISTEPFTADPAASGADSGKELSPTEKPLETNLDAVRESEETEEISGKEAESIVDSLNESMDKLRTRLGFKLDDKAGEIIGTVGRTGIKNSAPHLHFAIAIREGRKKYFIDPEPMLKRTPFWAVLRESLQTSE